MTEKYEQAIKETFKYLNDCCSDAACIFSGSYAEAIEHHMTLLGFDVYCTYNHDQSVICVYPQEDNLPIHIWRKK